MEEFLKFDSVYSDGQERIIADEFKRTNETCYLDHAGAALYSEKQMQNILSDFCDNIYANPHSLHISSKLTEDHVDLIRFRILQHFNTTDNEYSLIFTSGATQSLKTVGETFDYGDPEQGTFIYLQNNHTSVLGLRNYSNNSKELQTEDAFRVISQFTNNDINEHKSCNNLFAYPAQCNFSGTKYPLDWIQKVKEGALNSVVSTKTQNWYVLLDAPGLLSHDTLDLSQYKPDFVTVSFYKIFGYPTGLGALLVRKCSEGVLRKKYFGGGTVLMALSTQNLTVPRKTLNDRFEDGTLPFLGILSLKHGFDTLLRLKLAFDKISKHTFNLARFVYKNLLSLHHSNGQPVALLYHDTTFENSKHQGAIINFSLLRENGEHVGYAEVLHLANLQGIHLRTGCHCNPGACQRFLKLQSSDVIKHFNSGHVCGDKKDLIDGQPTGTIRISFGYMSTKKDADQFLKLIEDCFVCKPIIRKIPNNFEDLQNNYKALFYPTHEQTQIRELDKPKTQTKISSKEVERTTHKSKDATGTLEQIFLYPIKSCAAFSISNSWTLTKKGLKFDREWMIVNSAGVCLTQKLSKKMCLIKPFINLKKNTLKLNFEDQPSIEINIDEAKTGKETYLCQSKVCGDRVIGWDCGDEISDWLSENLKLPGLRLLRQFEPEHEDLRHQLSFANEAQYLMINTSSVEWLRNQVPVGELHENVQSTLARFRPNLVVKFANPFEENQINKILMNGLSFKFSGNCTRCQMICIDQATGNISKEPLLSLSRSFKGKITFGIYLNQENFNNEGIIKLGSKIVYDKKTEI